MSVELAIGFFDGVHLGHRRILSALARRAKARKAKAVVYTFLNHPTTVFAPERAPKLLMTPEQREVAIKGAVDVPVEVRMVKFTKKVASESPAAFARFLKREWPDVDTVFCGANWTFGAGGKGDAAYLRSLGFDVRVVPYAVRGGEPVSSTRIRAALAAGGISAAAKLLGRPIALSGVTRSGKGVGRSIGFPTINVIGDFPALPLGVFAVDTKWGRAIANWGLAPTMGKKAWKKPVFEIHLLEHKGRLAVPKSLSFRLLKYIRAERKFATTDELVAQIRRDISATLGIRH